MLVLVTANGFMPITRKETPREQWEKASENAITLWNQPYEEVKVEITKKYVKFFRRDDMLTCYTYPPLHELKKDKRFIQDITDIMLESSMYYELVELLEWIQSDNDMPQFPISVIFHSEYQNYKFQDWE